MLLSKCCTQYVSNLENSAMATGPEKVSFRSNPKEGNTKECSNYHTIALTSHFGKKCAQNSPSQVSTVRELRTSRCSRWIWKRQKNQISNCQHLLDHKKAREFFLKKSTFASLTTESCDSVCITRNCGKFFKRRE